MGLGPKLVIQGSFLGSVALSIVLYLITADLSYPQTPLAAALVEQVVHSNTQNQEAYGEPVVSGEESTGNACVLSARFPGRVLQWRELITHYAGKRSLPPDLIAALIWQESGGNAEAYSRSGAVGLMQVMPSDGLAANFICANGPCFASRPTTQQLKDPEFNISFGTKMLAGLLTRYGDLREALKAYGPADQGYYYADKVLGLFHEYGNSTP